MTHTKTKPQGVPGIRPLVYVASPYTKGDPAINTRFQMVAFDRMMNDRVVWPVVPLWSHFQHIMWPRPYQDWVEYDRVIIARCDACIRLDAINWTGVMYHQHESEGADAEVALCKELGIPVFKSLASLYTWTRHLNLEKVRESRTDSST